MFVNVAHAVIDTVPEQDKMNIDCDFVHAQRTPPKLTFLMANFQTIFLGGKIAYHSSGRHSLQSELQKEMFQ